MTPAPGEKDCLIEVDTALVGVDAAGKMDLLHDVAIRVLDGLIVQIGPLRGMIGANGHLPRYGGKGYVAMAGLTNGHHHFGITPLMAGVPFEPLELWLPRFRAMRSVGGRLDTLFSAIEMLESGTTSVHHIASGLNGGPEQWHAAADEVFAAYDEIGMRVGYSVMLRDRNILTYGEDERLLSEMPKDVARWFSTRLYPAVRTTKAYMDFHTDLAKRHENNSLVRVNYAPANLHWCSDELLEAVRASADSSGARIHMHLSETTRQSRFARERYGMSAVQHLATLGFLGPNVTLGHANWLEQGDADILASCGCSVCHNASSGLRLGSGRANVRELTATGVEVALGIDQSNLSDDRDMLLEMKLVWALHRGPELESPRLSAADVYTMATQSGAKTLGFGDILGRIECGRRADIVILDRKRMERPFIDRRTPLEDTILHRAQKDAVRWVFVDGRKVVEDGRVLRVDREKVLDEITERLSKPPSEQDIQGEEMVRSAMPFIGRHLSR